MHEVPDLRRQRRWQLGGLAVVSLVVLAVALVVGSGGSRALLTPGRPVPGAAAVRELLAGIPERAQTLGRAQAPVTLVEFGDLQCPTCAEFAQRALPGLVRDEVRRGRLQIQFQGLHFLGSDSTRADRMAIAVGEQDQLWSFTELLYANQRDENTGYVTDTFLAALAGAIARVDVALALRRRSSPSVSDEMAHTQAQVRRLSIDSTPSFLLGRTGGTLSRFTPADLSSGSFSSAVDRLLAG